MKAYFNGNGSCPSSGEAKSKWEEKADKASGLIYLALSQPQCIHINGIDDNPIAMWKRLEEVHLQQTAQLSWPSLQCLSGLVLHQKGGL